MKKCEWCDNPATNVVITSSVWTEDREVERATYVHACEECCQGLSAIGLTDTM